MDDRAEMLEILDPDGQPSGRQKPRGEIHRDGDWHRAFHLWIVRERRLVLLQRRARSKDLAGGLIDVTVGGHMRPGETLPDMLREVEEELGVEVRPGELHYLGTFREQRQYRDALDREFQETYLLLDDRPLEHYTLDCREVSVLYEAPLEAVLGLYRQGGHLAAAGWDCQQRHNNALLIEADLIEQARAGTTAALELVRQRLADRQS